MTAARPQLKAESLLHAASTWAVMVPLLYLSGVGVESSQDRMAGDILTNGQGPEAGPEKRILEVLALLLFGFVMAKGAGRIRQVLGANKWVFALPALCAASAFWSQNPTSTILSTVVQSASTIFILWFAGSWKEEEQMKLIVVLGAILAVATVTTCVLFPGRGLDVLHDNTWQGLYYSKNNCGRMTLFFLTPALHWRPRIAWQRPARLFYIVTCLGIIVMSQSKTAIGLTVLYFVFFVTIRIFGSFSTKDRLLLAVVGTGLAAVAVAAIYFFVIPRLDANTLTLTGRTGIWRVLLQSAVKRPLIGYGYTAFWTGTTGEGFSAFMQMHEQGVIALGYAHSGYLDLGLQLGFSGLAIIAAIVIRFSLQAVRSVHPNRPGYIDWFIGLVLLTIIYNFDEVTFVQRDNLSWLLFILACIGMRHAAMAVNRQTRHKIMQRAGILHPEAQPVIA